MASSISLRARWRNFLNLLVLPEFSKSLLEGIHEYRGHTELDDDITLLTLRRSA